MTIIDPYEVLVISLNLTTARRLKTMKYMFETVK